MKTKMKKKDNSQEEYEKKYKNVDIDKIPFDERPIGFKKVATFMDEFPPEESEDNLKKLNEKKAKIQNNRNKPKANNNINKKKKKTNTKKR